MTQMRGLLLTLVFTGMTVTGAGAQSPMPGGMPPPAGMSLARSAAMRFPQPVRVGDLRHRLVLQPVEAQTILGRVQAVVRNASGEILIVMTYGGFMGVGGRPIAVPADAMVLLGQDMEVVAFSPRQLAAFPTYTASGMTAIADDTTIKIGLAKPSH